MKNEFLVASKHLISGQQRGMIQKFYDGDWYFLYSKESGYISKRSITVLIDGYILPRNDVYRKYQNHEQSEIVFELYNSYGDKFLKYLKGVFIILIVDQGIIKIFTDHLGINKTFYHINNDTFCFSNNFKLIATITGLNEINGYTLGVKALLNREINGKTIVADIYYSSPAAKFIVSKDSTNISTYWDKGSLICQNQTQHEFDFFSNLFIQNIRNHHLSLNQSATAITLTGGKDSRTALAALLHEGIKPLGFTYGNPNTIDAVYASQLAKKADIEHLIINPDKTTTWFENTAKSIISLNNPIINIHRSHRYFAIQKITELLGDNTSLYSGYMGGELLMGVYFDNLIFTNFIKDFWNEGPSQFEKIPELLRSNFLRHEAIDTNDVQEELNSLDTFNYLNGKKKMQYDSLFEIGVLHHSQDLQIAQQLLNYPIPFFLDIEFLESLFKSRFSFLSHNVETKNLLKRHSLFEFNLTLQHLLHPRLDSVNFAKKGTYNTKEFLKGPQYWAFLKVIRYFTGRKKYPPTFSYDKIYISFLIAYLNEIIADRQSPIHEFYDVELALSSLKEQETLSTESPLHKYSNIVMHYLQYKEYTS